jgi:hypothetical protein
MNEVINPQNSQLSAEQLRASFQMPDFVGAATLPMDAYANVVPGEHDDEMKEHYNDLYKEQLKRVGMQEQLDSDEFSADDLTSHTMSVLDTLKAGPNAGDLLSSIPETLK